MTYHLKRLMHRYSQFSVRKVGRFRRSPDEVGTRGDPGSQLSDNGTQPAPEPVTLDGTPDLPPDGVRDPRWKCGTATYKRYRERAHTESSTAPEGAESCPVADSPDQAERWWRPLSRRA